MTYTGRLGSAASQPGRIKLGALDEPAGAAVNISAVAAVQSAAGIVADVVREFRAGPRATAVNRTPR